MMMLRTLTIVDEPSAVVRVRIHAPVEESLDWSCRVEIDWPDGLFSRDITGIDAVQALQLAMQMAGTQLYCSEWHDRGQLVWLEPGGGYGFPVPATIRDVLVGRDRRFFGGGG